MDKVVHFEIPSDALERTEKFYTTVFGWKVNISPENGYALVTTVETDERGMPNSAGAINGGLIQKSATSQSPMIVIKVKDIDDAFKKVQQAGGSIAMKTTDLAVGLYARIKDSEGNVVGLWQDIAQ